MPLAVRGFPKRTSSSARPAFTPPSVLDINFSDSRMPGLVDSPMASEADNYSWPQKPSKPGKMSKEELRRELERVKQGMVFLENKAAEIQESAGQKRKRLDELPDVAGAPNQAHGVRKVPKLKIRQQGQLVRSADFGDHGSGEKRKVAKGEEFLNGSGDRKKAVKSEEGRKAAKAEQFANGYGERRKAADLAEDPYGTGEGRKAAKAPYASPREFQPASPGPLKLVPQQEQPWPAVGEIAGPSGRPPVAAPLHSQQSLKSPKARGPLFEPVSIPGTWELLEECKQVMQHLSKNKSAGAFRQPVDVVGLGLPNYYDIVKEPMDLSLVRDRLARGYYTTPAQFARDVRLIWSNCMLFNGPGSSFTLLAEKMSQTFEAKFAPIEQRMQELGLTSVEEEDERVAREKEEMEAERQAKMLEDKQKAIDRYYELQQQAKDNEIKSAHRAQERAQQRAAAAAAAAALAEQARQAKGMGGPEAQAEPEPVVRVKREASKRANETVHRLIAEQRGPMPKLEAPPRRHRDKKKKQKKQRDHDDKVERKAKEPKPPKEPKPKREKQPKRERGENGVNKSGMTYAERSQLPMTVAEKQKLASDIQKLPEEKMEQVVDIVREYLGPEDQDADIVLDVNAMDHKTLWELRRFVSNFLKSRTKWLRRMERREKEGYVPRQRAPRQPKKSQEGTESSSGSDSGSESGSASGSGSESGSGSGSDSDSDSGSSSGSGSGSDSDVDVGDEHAQSEVGPVKADGKEGQNGLATSDGTSRAPEEKGGGEEITSGAGGGGGGGETPGEQE